MNVKITKEDHDRLCKVEYTEYLFGSRLFGTHTEDSDFDYIRVYKYNDVFTDPHYHLPNIHSFQFDDSENNTQYVWMTEHQFWNNLYSGDGTMQSDIVMFSGLWMESEILTLCRTYKVIRAYCGVAKRDVTLHGKNRKKRFHAERSLYIAESLIDNKVPDLSVIQTFKGNSDVATLISESKELRRIASSMYEKKSLHNYHIPITSDSLLNKMLDANNIREFKY
jgi:hypothetical protein